MQKLHHIFFLLLALAVATACYQRQQSTIKQALALANESPDSALKVLDGINRHSLSDGEQAMYALAYTLAQDKSGLDVDNDSLIRLAYDHYKNVPTDSLYGRCMYYMGKYYMLVDSLEHAKYCLGLSEKAFCSLKDTANQCLALLQLSCVDEYRNPKVSLAYSQKAVNIYRKFSGSKPFYMMMYTINELQDYFFCGDTAKAVFLSNNVLRDAEERGDSDSRGAAYHNLSWIYTEIGKQEEALRYALSALEFYKKKENFVYFNLAHCYENCGRNEEAYNLLDTLQLSSKSDKFRSFHSLFQLSYKMRKYEKLMSYADSAFDNLAQMYIETFNDKDRYYAEAMENVEKTSYEKGRASQYQMIVMLLIFLSVISALWLSSAYSNHQKKVRLKMQEERELARKEKEAILKECDSVKERYDKELEKQSATIELLREYIVQKVDIICRLKSFDGKSSHHVVLNDQDWKDIEEFLDITSDNFVKRIREKFPDFKEKEYQMLMLIRIDLPTKTLANIYGISEKSVKQRLLVFKKKVGLYDPTLSLRDFVDGY